MSTGRRPVLELRAEFQPRPEEAPPEGAPAARCASPYCRRKLPDDAPALVVGPAWSRSLRARVCGFRCLRHWAALMDVAVRAQATGELDREGAA